MCPRVNKYELKPWQKRKDIWVLFAEDGDGFECSYIRLVTWKPKEMRKQNGSNM